MMCIKPYIEILLVFLSKSLLINGDRETDSELSQSKRGEVAKSVLKVEQHVYERISGVVKLINAALIDIDSNNNDL